jgi:hypothetical protein
MNTHESYASLKTAKMLEEAGFDWSSFAYYDTNNILCISDVLITKESSDLTEHINCLAPTLEVAQRWLRDVKDIYTMVFKDFATIDGWHYFVVKKEDWESGNESNFCQQESNHYTYEESQEAGIKKAVELILEKGE